jgi:hypothetical protein
MSCCGGKRRASGGGSTQIKYTGQVPVKVLGGSTGRTYQFARTGQVISVDNRDLNNVLSIPGMQVFQG